MKKLENYLFIRGKGNVPLFNETIKQLEEYAGKTNYGGLNFATWPDGCPNDRIPNYEKIEGKTIVFFENILTKEDLHDYLSLCWALKHQYKAKRLIAVTPFNLLRRCDHDEKTWEIQYLRQYISFLAHAGVSDLVVCTPHSIAFEEYCAEYKIQFHPVYMDFTPHLKTMLPKEGKVIFYSPDEGSIARAIAHARKMRGSIVLFDLKHRKKNNQTEIVEAEESRVNEIIARYKSTFEFKDLYYVNHDLFQGANIIMIDDEMTSGRTANATAHKLRKMGAETIIFAFTHAVCSRGWKDQLNDGEVFDVIISSNAILRGETNRTGGMIVDVSAAQVLSSAIYNI